MLCTFKAHTQSAINNVPKWQSTERAAKLCARKLARALAFRWRKTWLSLDANQQNTPSRDNMGQLRQDQQALRPWAGQTIRGGGWTKGNGFQVMFVSVPKQMWADCRSLEPRLYKQALHINLWGAKVSVGPTWLRKSLGNKRWLSARLPHITLKNLQHSHPNQQKGKPFIYFYAHPLPNTLISALGALDEIRSCKSITEQHTLALMSNLESAVSLRQGLKDSVDVSFYNK